MCSAMGAPMIPEFLLLGQIVKKEDAACPLLQKGAARKKERLPSHLNSPSALHRPSLSCIYEETRGEDDEDEEDTDSREVANNSKSHSCGLSLFVLLSFLCPPRRKEEQRDKAP